MFIRDLLQRIAIFLGYFVLGVIAPWWVFIPMVSIGIITKTVGFEIIILAMALDRSVGESFFSVGYSIVVLSVYLTTYITRARLMR